MPGKAGGFFKRLKAQQKSSAKKAGRGTTGMKKHDRIVKHNALVDIYAAQKKLRDMEELAPSEESSDADGDDASSASSAPAGERSLATLRAMLGVTAGKHQAAGASDDDDADDLLLGDDEENDAEEEEEGGEEDEEPNFCTLCGLDLADDADGVACPECKLCYCAGCHAGTHAALGHKVVHLVELDDDDDGAELDADEEEELDEGDDEEGDEDEGDAAAEHFDAEQNELTVEDRREQRRAFLPQFVFNANVESQQVVAGALGAVDPFYLHFIADQSPVVASQKKNAAAMSSSSSGAVDISAFAATLPLTDPSELGDPNATAAIKVASPQTAAWIEQAAQVNSHERPPHVSEFIWTKWVAYKATAAPNQPVLCAQARAKLALMANYDDLNCSIRPWSAESSWIDAVVLHMLNHWGKSVTATTANDEAMRLRSKKQKAGGRLSKSGKKAAADDVVDEGADADDEFEARDRGFAKTRLLLVVPMRNLALRYLQVFRDVLGTRDTAARMKFEMFERDFSELEDVKDPLFDKRPVDYKHQFGGNINDSFCVGATLQVNGVSVYAHPLNSDLLVCSPLGLRKRLAKDADALLSLSSIEVAIFDQAHVLYYQNWDHAVELMRLLNQRPRDTTEGLSDLSRVYGWALEDRAAEHRQTVFISAVAIAAVTAALRVHCTLGHRGRSSIGLSNDVGVLPVIAHSVRQHVTRFNCDSPAEVDDARFEYFTKVFFASQVRTLVERNVRAILYVPSYFDMLRLRVFLDAELRGSFAELTEHSSEKAQRQALGQFSALERPLLVMTERFFFFKRYFVKHAEAVVFYAPPVMPLFYSTLINKMDHASANATVHTLCCRYDYPELARVLGTGRAQQVLSRQANSFIFVSTTAGGASRAVGGQHHQAAATKATAAPAPAPKPKPQPKKNRLNQL